MGSRWPIGILGWTCGRKARLAGCAGQAPDSKFPLHHETCQSGGVALLTARWGQHPRSSGEEEGREEARPVSFLGVIAPGSCSMLVLHTPASLIAVCAQGKVRIRGPACTVEPGFPNVNCGYDT